MNTTIENLSRLFDKKRKEIRFLAFFGPFIGGFLQVLELGSISIEYLRFFSATQLLGDSLVIIIFLLIVTSILGGLFELLIKYPNHAIFGFFSLIFLIAIPFVFTGQDYRVSPLQIILSPNDSVSLLIFILFWILGVRILYVILRKIPAFRKKIDSLKRGEVIRVISVNSIFYLFLGMTYLFSSNIHNALVIPQDLENFSEICSGRGQEKCSVRYFNDKYIFLEIDEKIRIMSMSSVIE